MDRLPALVAELVRLKPDVIVTGNDQTTRAVKQLTNTIPIVALLYNVEPVTSGFIDSFNRPGGNVTGMSVRDSELAGKRLELLREIMPGLARVAVFWDLPAQDELEVLKSSAKALGVQLSLLKPKPGESIESMFKAAVNWGGYAPRPEWPSKFSATKVFRVAGDRGGALTPL